MADKKTTTTHEVPRTTRPQPPAEHGEIIEGQFEKVSEGPSERLLIMQQERFMSRAETTPVDWARVKADLSSQLAAFPESAEKCIYSKPVGMTPDKCRQCGAELKRPRNDVPCKKCTECPSTSIQLGAMQFARGLSIHAAETIDAAMGFSQLSQEVEELENGNALVTVTYTDFRSCRSRTVQTVVSRSMRGRAGTTYKMDAERFWGLKVKAEASKLVREAILRSAPSPVRMWFYQAVEEATRNDVKPETIERIVRAFSEQQVSTQDLGLLLGKPWSPTALTQADVDVLRGMFATLKTEETRDEFYETLERYRADVTLDTDKPKVAADTAGALLGKSKAAEKPAEAEPTAEEPTPPKADAPPTVPPEAENPAPPKSVAEPEPPHPQSAQAGDEWEKALYSAQRDKARLKLLQAEVDSDKRLTEEQRIEFRKLIRHFLKELAGG